MREWMQIMTAAARAPAKPWRARDHRHARVRGAAPARVQHVHRREASGRMVGAARLEQSGVRGRSAAGRQDPDPHAGARRHRAPDGRRLHEIVPHERIAFTTFVDMPDGKRIIEVAQHRPFEDSGRQDQGDPARARRRLHGFLARTCSPAWRPAGRRASTSSPRMRRAQTGNKDADDQAAIRAIFGDRTNALFGKVADLAVKHFADDAVSYDLDPPLQHLGPNKARCRPGSTPGTGRSAGRWAICGRGRRRHRVRARARPHDRHQEGRRKGRCLDARHRLRAPPAALEDHAPAQFGAVPDGRQLQGRGRSEAVTVNKRKRRSHEKSLRSCGSTAMPKRR